MPWEVTGPVRERERFIEAYLTGFYTITVPKRKARYVKVIARNFGTIPAGNPGAGSRSLLFVDEIQVY